MTERVVYVFLEIFFFFCFCNDNNKSTRPYAEIPFLVIEDNAKKCHIILRQCRIKITTCDYEELRYYSDGHILLRNGKNFIRIGKTIHKFTSNSFIMPNDGYMLIMDDLGDKRIMEMLENLLYHSKHNQ